MIRFVLALLVGLSIAVSVKADSYVQGTDGYFYLNGTAHSRTWVAGSTYLNCGRYYQSAGYYSYTPVVVAAAQVPAFTPNWKSDLIKFLAHREDEQSYVAALKAIGLNPPGYVVPQQSALYGTFGVNTSTVYGYQQSLAQYADPFKPNLDQYFLQAFQLSQGAQDASKDALQAFHGTVQLTAEQAARIAAINARRDAHVAFAKILDGPPSASSSSTLFQLKNGALSPVEVLPSPKGEALTGSLQQRWNMSAQRCSACHYGNKVEGGFSVDKFPSMPADKQLPVVSRLMLPKSDPKFMPKGGDPIPPEELRAWIEVLSQPKDRK